MRIDGRHANTDEPALLRGINLKPAAKCRQHAIAFALAAFRAADADETKNFAKRIDRSEFAVEFRPVLEMQIGGDLLEEFRRLHRLDVRVDGLFVHARRHEIGTCGRTAGICKGVCRALRDDRKLCLAPVPRSHHAEDGKRRGTNHGAGQDQPGRTPLQSLENGRHLNIVWRGR